MTIKETNMTNVFLIKENIFEDQRGKFLRIWDEITYSDKKMIMNLPKNTDESLIQTYFVQDNVSYSKKGVFRGLHYQVGDWSQAKLVRVLKGRAIDFIVDLREESETFGKFEFFDLDDRDGYSLFIPSYYAHGFLSLQEDTIFHYKCGNLYKKENEGSITPFDNIIRHVSDNKSTIKDIVDMYLVDVEPLLSEKDLDSPKFMDRRIN